MYRLRSASCRRTVQLLRSPSRLQYFDHGQPFCRQNVQIRRASELSATSTRPADLAKNGAEAPKKGREIPFPSLSTMIWAIPVAVASMTAYIYFLEPYKYKKSDVFSLNNANFSPCILINKDNVSDTGSVFSIKHGKIRGFSLEELWQTGTWSVEIKQPQLQISRYYTPLPPVDAGGRILYDAAELSTIRLLVRRERNGEVSNYLHSLPNGAKVEIRGPFPDFELPKDVGEVIFIAGGTGIAPALQVAYAMATRKKTTFDEQQPRMNVLWSTRSRDDAYGLRDASDAVLNQTPVRQMEKIAQRRYNDLGIDLSLKQFVDERKQFLQKCDLDAAITGVAKGRTGEARRKIVLVSGPEGFVQYVAGPKLLHEGKEVQGPIRGLLSQVDLTGWEVIKL